MRIKNIIKDNFLPLLAILLLLLVFFGEFLSGATRFPMDKLIELNPPWTSLKDGEMVAKSSGPFDAVMFNYPLYSFLKSSFNGGEFPLWNPYILSGTPAYTAFSVMGLSAFLFPLSLLYDINMLIIMSIALIGMYVFLVGSVKVNGLPAIIGTVTFAFSGFFMVWIHQTYSIAGLVFLPWNLYFLDKSLSRKSIPYAIATGITISFALVNGVPQMFIYALMAITAFFIFRTLPSLKHDRKEALTFSFFFLLILGIGFCLSGIYLFPYLELLQSSQRPDLTYAQVTNTEGAWGAQPLRNLVTYLIPDFFGNYADRNMNATFPYMEKVSYLGIVSFMLAIIALVSEKNRYTYFFFGLAVFSLLMALGSPVYAFFYYAFPILSKARSIVRINILINFSIAVLAAIGAHNLMEGKINRKTILLICWGFLLAFAAGYFIFYDNILEKPKHQFLLQFIIWITALFALALYGLRCMPNPKGEGHRSEKLFLYLCLGTVFFIGMRVYYAVTSGMHARIDYSRLFKYSAKYDFVRPMLAKFPSQWYPLYIPLIAIAGMIVAWGYFSGRGKSMPKRLFFVFFVFLASYDLIGYGMRVNPYIDKRISTLPKTGGIEFLQKDHELYRILPFSRLLNGRSVLPANTTLPYELQNVSGYEGIYPNSYNRLISEVELKSPFDIPLEPDSIPGKAFGNMVKVTNFNSVLLDMLNVKYVVSDEMVDLSGWPDDYYVYIRNLMPVYYGKDLYIYRNKNYMQRAFIVPKVKIENDGEKIIKELLSNTFDPRRYAIVESKEGNLFFSPSDPILLKESSLTLKEYKNNSVSLDAEMKDQGFLVLADNYYPGWKVFVDGTEQPLYKTNYTLRGVHLEKGKHLVKFVYYPLSFKIGMYLSLSTLVGIMIYFIWHRFFKGGRKWISVNTSSTL